MTTTLAHDLRTIINQHVDPLSQFQSIEHYLLTHYQKDLYDEWTAPGILPYQLAKQWFTDYYVNDQNDGAKQAKLIQNQINHAQPHGYYWGQGDYRFGYDDTPTQFKRVTKQELADAITELMHAVTDPHYHMYQRVAN